MKLLQEKHNVINDLSLFSVSEPWLVRIPPIGNDRSGHGSVRLLLTDTTVQTDVALCSYINEKNMTDWVRIGTACQNGVCRFLMKITPSVTA